MRADMIGYRIGKLEVKEYAGARNGKALWKCQCECGETCFHTTTDLRVKKTQSCGCLQKEKARILAPEAGKKRNFKDGSCENAFNGTISKANTSGVRGVSFYKKSGKWRVQIKYAGTNYYLGLYKTVKEAADVRREVEEFIQENFNDTEKIKEYFQKWKSCIGTTYK